MIRIFFDSLKDEEFERLCSDILKYKLNEEFRCYKKGPDQGVDIESVIKEKNIIGQAKKYEETNFGKIKSDLEKIELPKVKLLNPSRYFLFISKELTRKQSKEIASIFSKYLNEEDIYDVIRIKDILNEKKAEYLLNKWENVWLSPGVLDRIYNKLYESNYSFTKKEILEESTLFVETKPYRRAKNILNKENIILIHGEPGVGKTTIAKELTISYIKKDYDFVYGNASDLKDIEKRICNDSCQIILIVDFLGSNYLDKSSSAIDDTLNNIIRIIRKSDNKKLILTTRTYIYNNAKEVFEKFYFCSENMDKLLVNVTDYNYKDKGQILYNHLKYNNLLWSNKYITLINNSFYKEIINHRNFNPRLISLICTRIKKLENNDIKKYILQMLDNPSDIWRIEYNKLTKNEKIFLNLVALFSYKQSEELILNEFKKILLYENIKIDEEEISSIIKSLSNEFITIIFEDRKRYFEVSNHGIVDFIINKFVNGELNIEMYLENSNDLRLLDQAFFAFSNYDSIREKIVFIVEKNLEEILKNEEHNLYSYNIVYEILSYDLTPKRELKIKKLFDSICMESTQESTHFLLDIIDKNSFLSKEALEVLEYKLLEQRDTSLWFNINVIYDLQKLLEISLNYTKGKKNAPFMLDIIEPLIDSLISIVSYTVEEDIQSVGKDYFEDIQDKQEVIDELAEEFFSEELYILKEIYTKKYYDYIYEVVRANLDVYIDEELFEEQENEYIDEENYYDGYDYVTKLFEENDVLNLDEYKNLNIPKGNLYYIYNNIENVKVKEKIFEKIKKYDCYLCPLFKNIELVYDLVEFFNTINIVYENSYEFYNAYFEYKFKSLNKEEIDKIYDIAYDTFCSGKEIFSEDEISFTLKNKLLKLHIIKEEENKELEYNYRFYIKEMHIFFALKRIYNKENILEIIFNDKFYNFYEKSDDVINLLVLKMLSDFDIQYFNKLYILPALKYVIDEVEKNKSYLDLFIEESEISITLMQYNVSILGRVSIIDVLLQYIGLSPTDILFRLNYKKEKKLFNKIKDSDNSINLFRITNEPKVREYFEKLGLLKKLDSQYIKIKKAYNKLKNNNDIDLYLN